MATNSQLLDYCVKQILTLDEKARKSNRLRTNRTEKEAIDYRNFVDNWYETVISKFVDSLVIYPKPREDTSLLFMKTESLQYHPVLDYNLILPRAMSTAINTLTIFRGRSDDIGKFCNLFALQGMHFALISETTETGENPKLAYFHLIKGFKELNIEVLPLSEGGINASSFFHWLIFDYATNVPDVNLLPELARSVKGDVDKFKASIVPYWIARQADPVTSNKFFYENVLPNVSRW